MGLRAAASASGSTPLKLHSDTSFRFAGWRGEPGATYPFAYRAGGLKEVSKRRLGQLNPRFGSSLTPGPALNGSPLSRGSRSAKVLPARPRNSAA